MNLPQFKPLK